MCMCTPGVPRPPPRARNLAAAELPDMSEVTETMLRVKVLAEKTNKRSGNKFFQSARQKTQTYLKI